MELFPGVLAVDFALYLPEHDTLILADPHLGHEESLRRQGVLVPRTAFKALLGRLDRIFSRIDAGRKGGPLRRVVVNGDLKHEFGRISRQEWDDAMRLFDYLQGRAEEVVLIKGNHDTILGPLAAKKGLLERRDARLGRILIAHGDKAPDLKDKPALILIGHEHPAITIRDVAKAEKFKCFLKGKYKGIPLIVQPSADLLTEGSDVTNQRTLSPLLTDLATFDVFVVDDKKADVLPFGPLRRYIP